MSKTKLLEEALSLIVHDGTAPLRAADFFVERAAENLEAGEHCLVEEDLRQLRSSIQDARAVIDAVRRIREIMHRSDEVSSFTGADLQSDLAFSFRKHTVTFDIPDVTLQGNHALLVIALSELIANSLQHSGVGAAHVKLDTEHQETVFVVSDAGPGIPEAFRARATKAFQVGSIEKKRQGFRGLGLFYVHLACVTMGSQLEWGLAEGRFEMRLEASSIFKGYSVLKNATALPVENWTK